MMKITKAARAVPPVSAIDVSDAADNAPERDSRRKRPEHLALAAEFSRSRRARPATSPAASPIVSPIVSPAAANASAETKATISAEGRALLAAEQNDAGVAACNAVSPFIAAYMSMK